MGPPSVCPPLTHRLLGLPTLGSAEMATRAALAVLGLLAHRSSYYAGFACRLTGL